MAIDLILSSGEKDCSPVWSDGHCVTTLTSEKRAAPPLEGFPGLPPQQTRSG